MQICRFFDPDMGQRLGLVVSDKVADLTTLDPAGCADISTWLSLDDPIGHLRKLRETVEPSRLRIDWRELDRKPSEIARHLLAPIDRQEVWGCGITYEQSRDAHMHGAGLGAHFYDQVYDSERPMLFLKATPHRVVGQNDAIRIRSDSIWTVPEPELTLLLTPDLEIVGFTCGNDVSSRDIEGENPLFRSQAKTYLGCCALGPAITILDQPTDAEDLEMSLVVIRDGATVIQGDATTKRMSRALDDIIVFLGRDNAYPDGLYLMTGSGVIVPQDFSLEPGDIVEITIENIGTLVNTVEQRELLI
jgi:2-dehydro-3-deoxy-D-arabinonate dehydratase